MAGSGVPWRVVDQTCVAGRAWNEDRAAASGCCAWVLDGAGVAPRARFPGHATDAAWLVDTCSDWLAADTARFASVDASIRALEPQLAAAFGPACDTDPAGGPTSCLVLARLDARDDVRARVTWALCGDVVMLVPVAGDGVRVVTDHRVKPFEAKSLAALRAAGPVADIMTPAARAQIRANRLAVNRDDGFALVCPSAAWASRMLTGAAGIDVKRPLVMMSDGLYRLVDVFARYDDAALYAACCTRGLAALLAELRAIEAADTAPMRHLRFKVHDDVSALVLAAR